MSRYQTQSRRMAFGVAAVAMTAIAITAAVIAPAKLDGRSADAGIVAAAASQAQARIEVAIIPAQIEVVGIRDRSVASSHFQTIEAFLNAPTIRVSGKPQG